jgi:hypothetical protein
MTLEEGVLFLLRRAKILELDDPLNKASDADQEAARKIWQEMYGLPLILDQAGAYIEQTACGLAGYYERYKHLCSSLLNDRRGISPTHPDSFAKTVQDLFKQIERNNLAAAELLQCCAFLEANTVPTELLRKGASALGPILEPLAEVSKWAEWDAAVEELRKHSFLRQNADTVTSSIHPLVQVVLRDAMSESLRHQWVERIAHAMIALLHPIVSVPLEHYAQCFPHIQRCNHYIGEWQLKFSGVQQLVELEEVVKIRLMPLSE